MKINSLSLKNWRSYNQEGISIDNFKHINLFIGPNNSGKSNLFRYLFHLKKVLKNLNYEKKMNTTDFSNNYSILNSIESSFEKENTWAWKDGNIECNLKFDYSDEPWKFSPPFTFENNLDIELNTYHNNESNISRLSCTVISDGKKAELIEKSDSQNPKVLNISSMEYIDANSSIKEMLDTNKYWLKFYESMVFIDPIRHFDRTSSSYKECDFDGSGIVQELFKIQANNRPEWKNYQNSMKLWLTNLLQEEVSIESIVEDRYILNMYRDNQFVDFNLNELGTGTSQLVMILSYLYLNKDRSLNVFMEEPELNLHPAVVSNFFDILESEFENTRFFVTTHSSTLINQIGREWAVYRVSQGVNRETKVVSCENLVSKYNILDDLGIFPSQLLQVNFIIWIEGPSDRIYLNKWIKDYSKGTLLEGMHYSFIFYGGTNLTSFSYLSEESVNIISASRYSCLICDSDKEKEDSKLKQRVVDMQNELDFLSTGKENGFSDYSSIWITSGREIENYVPENLLIETLTSDEIKLKYLNNGKQNELIFDRSIIEKQPFDKYDSFDTFFAKAYKLSNSSLNDEQTKKIENRLAAQKVKIAKKAVDLWESTHYSNNMDLHDNLNNLVEHIKKANNIQ
jgi:predicted ATP-dependent endonuclease of OLD family